MRTRIDGGRLLDLANGAMRETSLLVDDVSGLVVATGNDLPQGDATLQLHGEVILPGFIDVHVHLREPGYEESETIASGSRAAAAGGYSQVACMPNTNPVLDTPAQVDFVLERSREAGFTQVWPIASLTKGELGRELTDFEALKRAGAIALSDDGKGVQDSGLMLRAMKRAAAIGIPIAIHAEDNSLAQGGVVDSGAARRMGVAPLPPVAESAMVARDIFLAEQTGAHLHVCHVSTEATVAVVRWGKSRGVHVTAEVTPHHLLLNDSVIQADDGNYKVNPPLRSERDRAACLEGLLDGTIDLIATDHAPHPADRKALGLVGAPFGMVGLETAFQLLYTYLVLPGAMSLCELVQRMAVRPAQIFALEGGVLRKGAVADLAVVDVHKESTVNYERFYSKSRNTPFQGWPVVGQPVVTMRKGKIIHNIRDKQGGNGFK